MNMDARTARATRAAYRERLFPWEDLERIRRVLAAVAICRGRARKPLPGLGATPKKDLGFSPMARFEAGG